MEKLEKDEGEIQEVGVRSDFFGVSLTLAT